MSDLPHPSMVIPSANRYKMGLHITPSHRSNPIPSTSPINRHKAKDEIFDDPHRRLIAAENNIFNSTDHRISVTFQISHGDAIQSIAGSIKSVEELKVVAKYLARFVYLPLHEAPELYMVEAVLEQLRNRLLDSIDGAGGSEFIIQRNLERTFPDPEAPVTDREDSFIEGCLETMNQIQSVDKAIKYNSKLMKEF